MLLYKMAVWIPLPHGLWRGWGCLPASSPLASTEISRRSWFFTIYTSCLWCLHMDLSSSILWKKWKTLELWLFAYYAEDPGSNELLAVRDFMKEKFTSNYPMQRRDSQLRMGHFSNVLGKFICKKWIPKCGWMFWREHAITCITFFTIL
jgi:hypothetical protein